MRWLSHDLRSLSEEKYLNLSIMTVTVLMVAEKPSICNSVADALFSLNRHLNSHISSLQSRNRSPPVYEFNGLFEGRTCLFRITSVTGHLYSLDFPAKYQNWDQTSPLELFSAPTVHSPDSKGGIVKHLEREARGVDKLVLWMDCDREGENICFEVIRSIQHVMNKQSGPRNAQVYYRAKFSAVTVKDIEKAMGNLVAPNENESKSVDARQELDLKVGVAFSRFQTRYFQGKYGNLDSSIISYGPCQTPTLGFCVQRHDEIQSFVPEPFWTIDVAIEMTSPASNAPRKITLDWERGRLFDQGVVEMFSSMIQANTHLLCYEVKTSETKRTRPQPLNTVEMLKLASKNLGIGPHAAMRAAEYLYLSGYISYPRTESTAYPKSFDIRDALRTQRDHPDWGNYCQQLLNDGYTTPRAGHDAGDHPPITPVGLARDLSGDNWKIYELVTTHFLATISKDATFLQTKAKFRTNSAHNEEFMITGRRLLDAGFLQLYGNAAIMKSEEDEAEIQELPDFRVNTLYPIAQVNTRQGMTSAPGYLTESELIGLMEKHGIGTDASIPTHINNVLTRNYVTLGPGRTLVPTDLGIVLVHGYLRIDPDLVLPDVRAAIESFCNHIAKGNATKEEVCCLSPYLCIVDSDRYLNRL